MLNKFRNKGSNIGAWAIIALLIIGLTGFGLGGAVTGLATQNVATVGDEPVSRAAFARAVDSQIARFAQQTGQNLTPEQLQAFGLDRQILAQLVSTAAITGETRRLGISAGDTNVRDELVQLQQFQDISGKFDAATYRRALDRYGMSVSDFESTLRDEIARNLLASAISGGVDMPPSMARTILDFYFEKRSFSWIRLTGDNLAEPVAEPSEDDILAYYEAHPEDFQSLETRRVTYIGLTPEKLAESIEVSDEEIGQAYEARADQYQRPARRIVDRIVFRSTEQAQEAKSRLDAGEASFEDIASERGLTETDYQMGGIEASALDGAVRDAVFGTDTLGVLGPLDTALGPALFRINAIIQAQTTPLETVADTLRQSVAREKAAAEIGNVIEPVQDLLAGGATLEEIADETPLDLGEAAITEVNDGTDPITSDPEFRSRAQAAAEGDYPELFDLQGGGIAALRLDGIDPPALMPLDEVRDDVIALIRAERLQEALTALGDEIMAELSDGRSFFTVVQDRRLALNTHDPVVRGEALAQDLPASLSVELFKAAKGEVVRADAPGAVVLAQVNAIIPFDPEAEEAAGLMDQAQAELANGAAADLFAAFSQTLQDREGVSINQQLINQLLSANSF